mmetsp:Transcript_38093/g.100625  ORF Transcript_38093/g.100625 Transcript_38093/m.100625 type:complete len:557 (+) Transcript_38093:59-1729(+)
MSFTAKIETAICEDTLHAVPHQVERLATAISQHEQDGTPLTENESKKLKFLQQFAVAKNISTKMIDAQKIADLALRADALPQPCVGSKATMAVAARDRPDDRLRPDAEAGNRTAKSIAAFLQKEEVDDVALLAAEGRLATELGMFPVMAMPGTEQAVVARSFGSFRSWTSEDDAASTERERFVLLEVSAAAANLVVVEQMVADGVHAVQGDLDNIEQHLGVAEDDTGEAVVNLSDASNSQSKYFQWIVPSICLVLTGGAAFAGVHAVCVTGIAVRGAVVVGATAGSRLGTVKLAEWQEEAIKSIKGQLPRIVGPMPEQHKVELNAAGEEAQQRLLTALADTSSWEASKVSWTGYRLGLPVLRRRSEAREGGFSYLTFFTVPLPASQVFGIVRQLSRSGSLDPGCEFCLTCQYDPKEGTSLRYIVVSSWVATRTFHCVCHCSDQAISTVTVQGVEGDRAVAASAPIEKFVLAAASLSVEKLDSLNLPSSTLGEQRGCIHVCGIVVTAVGDQASRVEVMADVDPASVASLADRDVRLHVLHTAERITKEVHREMAQAA